MSPSDFLILLSILVAIVAIASANNKKIWLYKFDWRALPIAIFIIIWINYLIYYSSFRSRGLYIPMFECEKGIDGKNLAYVVSLIILFALIWYISKSSFFPNGRRDNLLQYYKDILNSNFPLLIEYINTYHKKNLKKYIESINKWAENEDSKDILEFAIEEREYDKKGKTKNSMSITTKLMDELVLTKPFIDNSMKIDPFWYLQLLCNLKTDRFFNAEEMIQYYCLQLIKSNNYTFMRELDEMFDHDDKNVLECLADTSYLKLIFSENYFVTRFDVFKVIGDAAILEATTRKTLFVNQVSESLENAYRSSLCYQYLLFHVLLYRYLAAQKVKNSISEDSSEYERYFFLHSDYLFWLYKELKETYGEYGNDTYAQKLMTDIKEWLSSTIRYCTKQFTGIKEPYQVPQNTLNEIEKLV